MQRSMKASQLQLLMPSSSLSSLHTRGVNYILQIYSDLYRCRGLIKVMKERHWMKLNPILVNETKVLSIQFTKKSFDFQIDEKVISTFVAREEIEIFKSNLLVCLFIFFPLCFLCSLFEKQRKRKLNSTNQVDLNSKSRFKSI